MIYGIIKLKLQIPNSILAQSAKLKAQIYNLKRKAYEK